MSALYVARVEDKTAIRFALTHEFNLILTVKQSVFGVFGHDVGKFADCCTLQEPIHSIINQ